MPDDEIDAMLNEILRYMKHELERKTGQEKKNVATIEKSIKKMDAIANYMRKELMREERLGDKKGQKSLKKAIRKIEDTAGSMREQIDKETGRAKEKEIKALIEKAIQRKAKIIKEEKKAERKGLGGLIIKRG